MSEGSEYSLEGPGSCELVHHLVFAGWVFCPLSCKFRDTLHQNGDLYKLDVLERRVPEDVHVSDDEPGSCSTVFKECDHSNVISGHDAVEDVVFALHVWTVDGSVGKVDELLVQQDIPRQVSMKMWTSTYLLFL